jgi:uncharacterized membrane protein YfcA
VNCGKLLLVLYRQRRWGVINAVAGGGGLITFPLLMLVTGPMAADATSALAGFASYPTAVWRTRNLLTGVLGSGWLWLLLIPSVLCF